MPLEVQHDTKYWPKSGTTFTFDLHDLWGEHTDKAETFVAESLIANPPSMTLKLDEGIGEIVTYLWAIGGDTLTVSVPLIELLNDEHVAYGTILSEEQAQDVRARLAKVGEIESAVAELRASLTAEIDAWEQHKGALSK